MPGKYFTLRGSPFATLQMATRAPVARLVHSLSHWENKAGKVETFFKVVTPMEALQMLLGAAPVGAETLNTIEARARVLAEDLYSQVDLPHFHRAAMDGYAVKAKDTFGASATLPAYIKVAGTVEMGKEAVQAVPNGAAMRISTGGMLPPGCDSVVMVEYTEDLGNGMVEIQRGVSPWQNVIQIGDDIRKGDLVFSCGRRLRAHDLGALTGIGVGSLRVFKKPIVALISTGDEIVDVTSEPAPGQVRNINQHSLAGMIEEWGGALRDYGVVAR